MQKVNEIKFRATNQIRSYFPVICLFVIGVAVSFAIFWFVHSRQQATQRSEFEFWAKSHANAVEHTLHHYIGALFFLGDFFNNSSFVTRQEFNNFVKSVQPRYPGIQAFGWNPLVKDDERTIYETEAKQEGFDNFEFTERSETNKIVRASRREEYVVVYYLQPMEDNRPAFGFDIASNSTRLKAITKSFKTGELTATGRVTLVQETGDLFGVLLLQPIYNQGVSLITREERLKNRKGFVVEVLRVGQAVEIALNQVADKGISLTLYDMSADEEDRFLYHRPSQSSKTAAQPKEAKEIQKDIFWSKTFEFADRQWKVLLTPSDFFYQSMETWPAWIVLFGLLSLTTLLALYMVRKTLYTAEIEQRVYKQAKTNQELKNEITARKQMEKELNQKQKQYERLVEKTPAILYAFSSTKGGTYYSPQVELILGYSSDHLLKNPFLWNESIHKDDKEEIDRTILQSKMKNEFEVEYRIKDSKGNWHWFLDRSISIQRSPDETIIEGLAIDFTARKKAEKEKVELQTQLTQAQKMESIGTLAGGIAHEFNNILSIIIGHNEIVMEELPERSPARESTEEIEIAGMRARDVVKQLLTFSKQDSGVKKIMNFRSVVQDSLKLIRSSIPVNIEIRQSLSEAVCPVLGNDTQINQLLINLCNNAVDAMPTNGGILTVELLNETVNEKNAKHHSNLKPGQYVKLVVSDNGLGMDKETIDRIFEPYYTTKEIGKGSGIGLAVVHGIIERHGGSVTVTSQPGQGTIFTIFLPAHENLNEQKADEKIILPTGKECILYVDDEPSIAKIGKRHLENLGYAVESTTDPLEALKMVKTDIDKFDLVISDMAMPNMTGEKLAIELMKIRPDIPFILCTGYSKNMSEELSSEIGIKAFAYKPIVKADLAKTVRKVLDEVKGKT